MNISDINKHANQIFQNRSEKLELKDLRELFSETNSLDKNIKYSPENEYLKAVILSQLNIDDILQKSTNSTFDTQIHVNEECINNSSNIKNSIYSKLDAENKPMLNFSSSIINSLFGDNDLGIGTKEEAEYCYKFNRGSGKTNLCFEICAEENFKREYNTTKNPIKKMLNFFNYKKLTNKGALEDKFIKNTRDFVSSELETGNIPAGSMPSVVSNRFQKCAEQYNESRVILALADTAIQSLQSSNEKINILDKANMARSIMQPYISDMMEEGLRQEEVVLGEFEPISHKEVKDAIDKLQERYDKISIDTNISDRQYVEECSEIFADFICIQPFNNGNKRTALFVLNSMLSAKGLVPPVLSVARGNELTKSLHKCQEKDYDDLKELLVSGVSKMNPDRNITDDSQDSQNKTFTENKETTHISQTDSIR